MAVGKRLFDVLVAAVLLVVTLPVQLLVAAVVRWNFGAPVLFRQERTGRNGAGFVLVKFRTMHHPDPGRGLVTDADRLSPLGLWLRRTSLDELPTLWNVLVGDMSLVGPRPLLPRYLDRYTPEQARRLEVRPGVTGWAQVTGRNALSWEEKFSADVWYVDHQSFPLDCRILARTVVTVLRRDGISAEGSVTASEFLGSAAHPRG